MMRARQSRNDEEHESATGDDIEQEYEIEYVFGKQRMRNDKLVKYAVKWEGFSKDEISWEPLENFVNATVKCVKRFERCLAYQQYYSTKKKTSTNGIKVHVLGPFAQVLIPEMLYVKPKPDSTVNRDARPIIKNPDSQLQQEAPKPLPPLQPDQRLVKALEQRAQLIEQKRLQQPPPPPPQKELEDNEDMLPDRPEEFNVPPPPPPPRQPSPMAEEQQVAPKPPVSAPSKVAFQGSFGRKEEGSFARKEAPSEASQSPWKSDQPKHEAPSRGMQLTFKPPPPGHSPRVKLQGSAAQSVEPKREEADDSMLRSVGRTQYLGKFGNKVQPKEEDPDFLKAKQYDDGVRDSILPKMYQEQLRQNQPNGFQPFQNTGKYKLLQQQPPFDHPGINPHPKERPKIKTERDYLNEIINAQRLKEQQQKSSMGHPLLLANLNNKGGDPLNIKANDGETVDGKLKLQDSSRQDILLHPQPLIPQLKTFATQEAQCDIKRYVLHEHLYLLERKGDRFLKLKTTQASESESIAHLITHSLAQIESDKTVRLVFQIKLESGALMFTTLEYLQEMKTPLLIDYILANAVFH